jgi:methylmalonyl-CoA mutase
MEPGNEGPVRLDSDSIATATDWDDAAAAVLRKARRLSADDPADRAWELLSRDTVEGVTIPPLGTAERAAGRVVRVPAGRSAAAGWDIRSPIADPDPVAASAAAVADLENGATSLWVTVGGAGSAPDDLDRAIQGVYLDMAPVVLSAAGEVTDLQAAQALAGVLRSRGVTPDPGTCLGVDPVGRALRSPGSPPDSAALIAVVGDSSRLATELGVRALVVDGTAAHDAGAGDAGELGYALAVGVAYLRALAASGLAAEQSLRLMEFRLAATADQFATIAKFRAARVLWDRVAELSGAAAGDREQFVHAVTSLPMLTRYDPWVNLLRTTVAAFAAGVGGADAVTVLPFDTRLGVPDALGRRMARNISSLLVSESHVAAVADPAAGSYAVEMLTAELAEAGWSAFQRIEHAGGILAAIADGSLLHGFAATAAERQRRIATRAQPITGVSEFPNLREVLPTRRIPDGLVENNSWAADFENLRDQPASAPIFLATLGPVAAHAARAGFAANLFAAGGIDTVTAGATTGVEDVVGAFTAAGATVACLAGSDPAYGEIGAAVIAALRGAGARHVVLAGRPRGELADLVDDNVAVGDDVVEFLRRTRAQLDPAEVLR